MRKYALLAAAASLAVAGLAKADFVVADNSAGNGAGVQTTTTVAPTVVTINGQQYNQWTLFVKNTGTGVTTGTTKLLALDVTLAGYTPGTMIVGAPGQGTPGNGNLVIRTWDSTGGGETVPSDADFSNLGGETPSASNVRFGGTSNFTFAGSEPNASGTSSGNVPNAGMDYTDFQTLPQFGVQGGDNLTTGGLLDTTFRQFAQVDVPVGQHFAAFGSFGPETGAGNSFFISDVPEPATLGLGALMLGGLAIRRRRA